MFPSLFLVCDSNTGDFSFTEIAPAKPFPDVKAGIVLLIKFIDALEDALAEGGEVGAAVAGELAIDK